MAANLTILILLASVVVISSGFIFLWIGDKIKDRRFARRNDRALSVGRGR